MPKKKKLKTETTDGEEGRRFTRLQSNQRGEGVRRCTRLQSKLSTFTLNSSHTPNSCLKVSSMKKIRLLESIEKVSKPMQHLPCRRDQESEGQSSSNLPSESEQPMLDKFTAPSPSRPLKDGVHAMYDNVLNNGNVEMREADSSPAAASVVGAQPVQQRCPNANPTFSYGLIEMANMLADEGSSEDEVESSGLITIIGKYSVKEALAPTVRRIIEKHGDIAANYVMQTPELRSLALEQLAKFIQKYDAEKSAELCEKKIERAREIVSDFGRGGFNVRWLEQRLKDLLEARKTVKQRSQLKEKKDKLNQVIKEKNAFLEIAEQPVITAKKELREALAEVERIKETIAKVKYFFDHPPFFGLL